MKLSLATAALLISGALAAPSYERLAERGNNKPTLPGGTPVKEPSWFTSAFSTRAIDSLVVNNVSVSTPGQAGAYGHFSYRINTHLKTICWDIRTVGVTGDYMSPAVTATHIHQGDVGKSGPPRLAFPNPVFVGTNPLGAEVRESKGCMRGPFKTGVKLPNSTIDSGTASGFRLRDIEANPGAFFTDTHTVAFPAGAIRGQLLRSELEVKKPKKFTSVIKATATPDQVVNANNTLVPGLPGVKGEYKLRIDSKNEILCYDIVLTGVGKEETYFSPAKTATHTHEAGVGLSGPPRLAYKNPVHVKGTPAGQRESHACVKGPFTTGLLSAQGVDTGSASGFTLAKLEANPAGFFSDFHTASRQAGAARGQNRAA